MMVEAVVGKSTDKNQIVMKGSPPVSFTNFVEVIGIADGVKSIKAEIWTNFGDSIVGNSVSMKNCDNKSEWKYLLI
ncbi:hypothetical protein UlMin_020961 [Ulmus minor]